MVETTLEKKKLLRTNPRSLTGKKDKDLRKRVIAAKKEALIQALKIPPAINQFRKYLSEEDFKEAFEIFSKYKPETRKERKERIERESKEGVNGPKPVVVKAGIEHVTSLIEQKKAKLVLIAADVDPVEIVLFLPTLCKKMGISYGIVRSKMDLGSIVGRKASTCVCLCDVDSEMKAKFDSLVKKCDGLFSDNYEISMKTWGNIKKEDNDE